MIHIRSNGAWTHTGPKLGEVINAGHSQQDLGRHLEHFHEHND